MWQRWVTTNMNDTKRSQTKSSFIPAPNFSKILKIHREKKLFIFTVPLTNEWRLTKQWNLLLDTANLNIYFSNIVSNVCFLYIGINYLLFKNKRIGRKFSSKILFHCRINIMNIEFCTTFLYYLEEKLLIK